MNVDLLRLLEIGDQVTVTKSAADVVRVELKRGGQTTLLNLPLDLNTVDVGNTIGMMLQSQQPPPGQNR